MTNQIGNHLSSTLDYGLTFLVVMIICIEVFINMPMNGVYSVPFLCKTKDCTIVLGGILGLVISLLVSIFYPIPYFYSLIFLFLYYIYIKCTFG